jgi:hypothetical protein
MTARDLPSGAAPRLAKDFAGIEGRLPYEVERGVIYPASAFSTDPHAQ